MDPQEAALTIDRIEELRRETRRKSRGGPEDLWVPILLFGVLMLFTRSLSALLEDRRSAFTGRLSGRWERWCVAGTTGAAS